MLSIWFGVKLGNSRGGWKIWPVALNVGQKSSRWLATLHCVDFLCWSCLGVPMCPIATTCSCSVTTQRTPGSVRPTDPHSQKLKIMITGKTPFFRHTARRPLVAVFRMMEGGGALGRLISHSLLWIYLYLLQPYMVRAACKGHHYQTILKQQNKRKRGHLWKARKGESARGSMFCKVKQQIFQVKMEKLASRLPCYDFCICMLT